MKHTPTAVLGRGMDISGPTITITVTCGEDVQRLVSYGGSLNLLKHTAHCVNTHDELVAMVKDLLDVECWADGEGHVSVRHCDTADGEETVRRAFALLSRAERSDT